MTRIVLKGRTEVLKGNITSVLALHQLLEERDIGQFLGYPIEDFVRRRRMSPLSLKVCFFSVPRPPWQSRDKNKKLIRASYSIPDIRRSSLDWDKIKLACGGANGYMWGRWRATAELSNASQMAVYGGSESEAEQRLLALHSLSDTTIETLSVAEEKKLGKRAVDAYLFKEATRVYPGYFSVVNKQKIINESNQELAQGRPKKKRKTIILWSNEAPNDFDRTITELLTIPGTNNP